MVPYIPVFAYGYDLVIPLRQAPEDMSVCVLDDIRRSACAYWDIHLRACLGVAKTDKARLLWYDSKGKRIPESCRKILYSALINQRAFQRGRFIVVCDRKKVHPWLA